MVTLKMAIFIKKISKKFEIYKNEMDKNILNYNLFAIVRNINFKFYRLLILRQTLTENSFGRIKIQKDARAKIFLKF